jgi:hypothetical protein
LVGKGRRVQAKKLQHVVRSRPETGIVQVEGLSQSLPRAGHARSLSRAALTIAAVMQPARQSRSACFYFVLATSPTEAYLFSDIAVVGWWRAVADQVTIAIGVVNSIHWAPILVAVHSLRKTGNCPRIRSLPFFVDEIERAMRRILERISSACVLLRYREFLAVLQSWPRKTGRFRFSTPIRLARSSMCRLPESSSSAREIRSRSDAWQYHRPRHPRSP